MTLNVAWLLLPHGLIWVCETADLQGLSDTITSMVYKKWTENDKNIQWAEVHWVKMPWWPQRAGENDLTADGGEKVTQLTTRYRYVKEHLLKQIPCYSSRRPHQLSLLSVKLRLQFTQTQQTLDNSRLEKLAWSVESQFLPQRSGGRVIIWYKQHVWPLSTHSMQIYSPTLFEGYSVLPFGVTYSRKDSSTHLPVLFCWANVRPLLDKLHYVN